MREISQHTLRIQKVLEDANLKLAQRPVGRARQQRPRDARGHHRGRDDPERLADLALGTARKKQAELRRGAARSRHAHHRTMLKLHLDLIAASKRPSRTSMPPWEKPWRRSSSAPAC